MPIQLNGAKIESGSDCASPGRCKPFISKVSVLKRQLIGHSILPSYMMLFTSLVSLCTISNKRLTFVVIQHVSRLTCSEILVVFSRNETRQRPYSTAACFHDVPYYITVSHKMYKQGPKVFPQRRNFHRL